ncbi:MAG: hypothetical protein KDD33_06730 [Bdellovibrionales bacterium]|nr:hypothetical protein [Bdellovibrionales bacterium]
MFENMDSKSLCLEFRPRKACFSKAQVLWRGFALNGLLSATQPQVDLSQEDLTELLFDLYGTLELVELSELYQAVLKEPSLQQKIDWPQFFRNQGLQYNMRLVDLLKVLTDLPTTFKNWAFEKKVSANDLMPLISLKDPSGFTQICEVIAERRLTRSEGKKAIDLLVDLFLMGKTARELMPLDESSWIDQLSSLRYPQTKKRDQQQANTQNQWPDFVQVQSLRQGDRRIHRMQIHYFDDSDLSEKLRRLKTPMES